MQGDRKTGVRKAEYSVSEGRQGTEDRKAENKKQRKELK